MQRTEKIELSKVEKIFDSIFKENVIVCENYSAFDSKLLQFDDLQSLKNHFNSKVELNVLSSDYALYYPNAKGYFYKEKINLNPESCDGAMHRYTASGWGVIHVHIDLRNKPIIEVRVAVNSAKRAENWSTTYSELKSPDLWDWKYVEKQTRRIIRVLKQCA